MKKTLRTEFMSIFNYRQVVISSVLLLTLFYSNKSIGQLSTAQTTFHVDTLLVNYGDTLLVNEPKLIASITPNDLNNLGSVYITVYVGEGLLFPEIVATKQQCVSAGWLQGSTMVIPLGTIWDQAAYRITVSLTNEEGMFIVNSEIPYSN